jgi:hypothetical protein
MVEKVRSKYFLASRLRQRLKDAVEDLQNFYNASEDEEIKKEIRDLVFVNNEFLNRLDDIIRKDYFVKTEVAEK